MSWKNQNNKSEDFSFRPFISLKSRLREQFPLKELKHNRDQSYLSDHEIFMQAMKDVKEIKEFRNISTPNIPIKIAFKISDPDKEVIKALEGVAKGAIPIKLSQTQEYIEWFNPDSGYSPIIVKLLHQGKFAVQDTLDLHGYTVDEADALVQRFIEDSLKRSFRCVKIIHGRGLKSTRGPILKKALFAWLTGKLRKNIICFVTARNCDGGLGAVYALLQTKKRHQTRQFKKINK